MRRACATTIVLAFAAGLLALLSAAPAAAADRDCPDFATQRQAQIYYLRKGGPQRDPDDLDRDNDGVACDSNPCPCFYGRHVPDGGTPAPHRRTVHSTVGLRVAAHRRIAGERNRFTVQVRPHRVRPVRLQLLSRGRWVTVARRRTSEAGRVALSKPTQGRTTAYRAVLPAQVTRSTRFSAARSTAVRVTTQRQIVSLSLPGSVLRGQSATARVAASPVRVGRVLELQRRIDGDWWTVATGRENRYGRMSRPVTTSTVGTDTYRAVAVRRRGAAAAASARHDLEIQPLPDTVAPAVPTGVVATAGDATATLSWEPVADADLAAYRTYISTTSGAWTLTEGQPGTSNFLELSGLANGTSYQLAVSAVDTSGNESALSDPVSVTPTVPPQP
jgi:hypothetical protein